MFIIADIKKHQQKNARKDVINDSDLVKEEEKLGEKVKGIVIEHLIAIKPVVGEGCGAQVKIIFLIEEVVQHTFAHYCSVNYIF